MFILRSNPIESEGGGMTTPDNKGGFHTRADRPATPSLDFY